MLCGTAISAACGPGPATVTRWSPCWSTAPARSVTAGCDLYVVAVSDTDADMIWVTEVWQGKEQHDASLELPATRAAIAVAMPMLTGEFTGQELTVVGGLGVPAGASAQ